MHRKITLFVEATLLSYSAYKRSAVAPLLIHVLKILEKPSMKVEDLKPVQAEIVRYEMNALPVSIETLSGQTIFRRLVFLSIEYHAKYCGKTLLRNADHHRVWH